MWEVHPRGMYLATHFLKSANWDPLLTNKDLMGCPDAELLVLMVHIFALLEIKKNYSSKWLYQKTTFLWDLLFIRIHTNAYLSSFLIFANLMDVKWCPNVSVCFLIKYFECLFSVGPLQRIKDATKKSKTWLLFSRTERWTLSACEWQRDTQEGVMCSPLGNVALVRDESWPWSWKMSRHFQQHTKLQDIPGEEEGTRQKHGAVKPHHSKNWVLLTVRRVPELARPGERQRRVCGRVGRLREFGSAGTESLVRVLSRVLTGKKFLSLEMDFGILKIMFSQAFVLISVSNSLVWLLFIIVLLKQVDNRNRYVSFELELIICFQSRNNCSLAHDAFAVIYTPWFEVGQSSWLFCVYRQIGIVVCRFGNFKNLFFWTSSFMRVFLIFASLAVHHSKYECNCKKFP